MFSGHTNPPHWEGIACPSWVQWLQTHCIRETYWTNTTTFEIQEVRWVIRYPLHTQDTGFKSRCALSLLKLRSRYETDCIIFIPCEGDFSLVLLVMFSHPYPTLVPSYPHPYSHLGKPIVLVWETWVVSLFRQPHPLKIPVLKINFPKCRSDIRVQYHCHMDELG